jgi:hypothetical protein
MFWNTAVSWVNSWCKPGIAITEFIPDSLSDTIFIYSERDDKKKENIELRMKKLQWWGRVIASEKDGLLNLNTVAKQYIWDSFLKGPEQVQLLDAGISSAIEAASEQVLVAGSIQAIRYMDISKKEPVYLCSGEPCAPSILKIFITSKTDEVVNAKANNKVTASPYGIMVVWENDIMFKTNEAKNAEGKPPGSGAACAIVSTVKGHGIKLASLGNILAKYHGGNHFELNEASLSKSLTGASSYCALMEIIMRWMDLRRVAYGNLRYFYRPLSSYYSGHKSKK